MTIIQNLFSSTYPLLQEFYATTTVFFWRLCFWNCTQHKCTYNHSFIMWLSLIVSLHLCMFVCLIFKYICFLMLTIYYWKK